MSKTLQDYPITFPFGVTTAPYTPSHPHRGDDRACPENTPIVVCGVTIGYVGMTGMADGYHCHNQEWKGGKTNVRKPQNAFKGGVVIEVDPIGNTGDGTWGKYVTVQNDDGWNSSYCHMNTTNAKVGQVLKGEDMNPDYKVNKGDIRNMWDSGIPSPCPQSYIDAHIGQEWKPFMYDLTSQGLWKDAHNTPASDALVLKPGKYQVN